MLRTPNPALLAAASTDDQAAPRDSMGHRPQRAPTRPRHSAASLLLALNIHPRVVMELLGHSQISLTMDTSHTVPEILRDAIDKLGSALNG